MKKILTATVLAAVMLCIVRSSFAQDSLHLVMTLTGESYVKRITNAVGVGDVNGDGNADFLVSMPTSDRLRPYGGEARLYLGGAKFDASRYVAFTIRDSLVAGFGMGAGAGDVNGDGYDDILISAVFNSGGERKGIVYLYLGGKDIDTVSRFSFYDKYTGMDLGFSISGAGDVNGDGYDDFLIGEPYNWTDAIGKAYLFLGGKTPPTEPAVTFVSDSVGDNFGYSVRGIGNVNGDRFDDFAISTRGRTDRLNVYLGEEEVNANPDTALAGQAVGAVVAGDGDIDEDSYPDVMIGYPIVVCYGSNGSSIVRTTPFNVSERFSDFGSSIAIDGDVNGDRTSDILMGGENHKNRDGIMVGGACVYLGGSVIDTVPSFCLEGETKWSQFGFSVSYVGDYNGDGYDEAIVVAPGYPDTTYEQLNRLGKVYVYSYKKIDAIKNRQEPLDPESFHLKQNYPNPFNPTTTIKFALPTQSQVTVTIYDILGREVKELVNDRLQAGYYHFSWNASMYATGVYFYRIVAQSLSGDRRSFVKVKKLLLLK